MEKDLQSELRQKSIRKKDGSNPFPYGTLENYLFWAYTESRMSLSTVYKKAAEKFSVTQVKSKNLVDEMFTREERMERGKRLSNYISSPKQKTKAIASLGYKKALDSGFDRNMQSR